MTQTMYVRFGTAPEGGRSANAETDELEAGVSCYRAEWQSADRDVICLYVPSDICIGTISQVEDRPVYILTGDLLDEVGGDGEPLMTNCAAELVGPVEVINYCVDGE
jgi:hypothetical protein